jgi:hypothetical protein
MCSSLYAQKDFVPDTVFKGSTLTGWHTVGGANWTAKDGQVTAAEGGWLVSDQKYQDVRLFVRMQCKDTCDGGVLLRAEKTKDGGLHGVYVSLAEGDLDTYELTTDASGKEIQRTKLPPAPPEVVGIGGPAGGARPPAPAAGASAAPAGPPAGGPRNRRPTASLAKAGDWNTVELIVENNALNGTLNDAPLAGGAVSPDGFGAIALHAGKGQIMLEKIGVKDVNGERWPLEVTSEHFTERKISDFYYGWSAVSGDLRKKGTMDIVSGPFIYLGPDYVERLRYREGRVYNPALEYAPDMVNFVADFNGDGWPDIVASDLEGGQRPLDLYINPKGESRRWTKSRAIDRVSTELVLMKDIDGDGKQEIIFGGNGMYAYAKPDPQDISAKWKITPISGQMDRINNHGMGVGDINGDGRLDLVTPVGWFEQPAAGSVGPWKFHEGNFGGGGAEMGIYDVNGDGLPDVVTSLAAHGFGLAWFEQKRSADGNITFVKHDIAGDYSTVATNAGGVTFSQPHAEAFADMDGDGIPDLIVGKSMWHHLEAWGDPDPYGPAVLYVYRTVRDPQAPGGARFVPEMVNNRSGVGSAIQVVDLNHDGAPDIITQSALGTFVFFGHPGKWPKAAVSPQTKAAK